MTTPSASRFARVIIDVPVPQPLDYRLAALSGQPGRVCVVPVGRRSQMGLIVDTVAETDVDPGRLKDIAAVIDSVAPLERHWLDFTSFAADYYQHPWGEVALPALPPVLRSKPGPRFEQALARLRGRGAASVSAEPAPRQLTGEQDDAVAALLAARGFGVYLLFGVTGS